MKVRKAALKKIPKTKNAIQDAAVGYSQTFVIWAEKKKDLSNDNLENNNKKMHFSGLDQNQAEQSRAANS
ncbi:hypothetical protein TYRP_023073 [Tyrophagus putrescentiae]|nr:hypothetical protein TYRP_023073 [Tyrophagus putrescentiae]